MLKHVHPQADGSGDPPDRPIGHGSTVGGILRDTREAQGLSLRDVALQLKIRAPYLDALERNELADLPGPAYAAGFLRSYADFLQLDGKSLVERLRREKTGLREPIPLDFPVPLTRTGIPGGGILLSALIVVLLGWGSWYYFESGAHSHPPAVEPVPARLLPPPPVAEIVPPKQEEPPAVLEPAPSETAPAATVPVVPATVPAATAVAAGPPPATGVARTDPHAPPAKSYGEPVPGRLVIRATGPCWIEVRASGKPVWGGLLQAGETYNIPNGAIGRVKAGNAGAIQFQVDGKAHGPFGALGEVKEYDLDPDALAARG
jgi:cytoskeleton protein RodZ